MGKGNADKGPDIHNQAFKALKILSESDEAEQGDIGQRVVLKNFTDGMRSWGYDAQIQERNTKIITFVDAMVGGTQYP